MSARMKQVLANSMTGTFEYEKGDKRAATDFNIFFRYVRHLSLLQRCGLVSQPDAPLGPDPDAKDDTWFAETAKKVYRPDIYLKAARSLVADGLAKEDDFPWDTDGYRAPAERFYRWPYL